MQTYARQHRLPLDVMRFLVEVTDKRPPLPGQAATATAAAAGPGGAAAATAVAGAPSGAASGAIASTITEPAPEGGVYVHGLTLEGESVGGGLLGGGPPLEANRDGLASSWDWTGWLGGGLAAAASCSWNVMRNKLRCIFRLCAHPDSPCALL